MRVAFSPQAEKDLEDIFTYLHPLNPTAAAKYLGELKELCLTSLPRHPLMGRYDPDILSGTRRIGVRHYLILYDVDGENISINRIIHGSRDLAALK